MKNFVILLALFVSACDSNPPSTSTPAVPAPVAAPSPASGPTPNPTPAPAPSPTPAPPANPQPAKRASLPKPAFMLETRSLYAYRTQEIASLSVDQIHERNDGDLAAFEAFNPGADASKKTGPSVTSAAAQAVIDATNQNPIVTPYTSKYQRPGVSIGYCFGRATFAHIALKKMGLQDSGVRKVWLVGPMQTGGVKWGFHVATAAYVENQGWQILDTNIGYPVGPREWFDHYSYMSIDSKLRFYVTSPVRFGVTVPRYERVDMGLDLSEEKDWYQHYFYDLMAWFRKADFHALGLDRVKTSPVAIAPSKTALDDIYASRPQVP